MRSRFSEWLRSDQALLVVLGGHALFGAVTLGWETYVTGNGRFFLPWAWPPVWLAAGLATVMYHRDRGSNLWWRASCALLVVAYLSRAATIGISANLANQWTARDTFGVGTWCVVATVVELLWVRFVTPSRVRNGSG